MSSTPESAPVREVRVALAGNPNAGKTTVFNNLTGAHQAVGNYPGKTVERKEGRCRHAGRVLRVSDLPGTYSLAAYSAEELIAREVLVRERPDVVVDVVDASNLERNLYLAVQLLELGVPLVLAFNMSDLAQRRGLSFDLAAISRYFGAPVVPLVSTRDEGTAALLDAVLAVADGRWAGQPNPVRYGPDLEAAIERLAPRLTPPPAAFATLTPRWLALKLLEHDGPVRALIADPALLAAADRESAALADQFGDPPEILAADRRYGFISGVCTEAVRSSVEQRHDLSDRIDVVLTNRVLGFPIFLGLMYLTFQLTFTLGAYPMGWLERLFAWLAAVIGGAWPAGAVSPLRSLLVEGVIGGVGSVVVFLPNIMLLFLAVALLEDSGYLARTAFLMDRLMHQVGLHGKSFIPLLTGFGCSVPAILATRTLENEKDRLTTMLVVPLISCGARLPIYALLIPAFFPLAWRGPVLWGLYVTGILLALGLAKLLRRAVFRGESGTFVLELPPYRLPTLRSLARHAWERVWLFLRKAGTLILGVSIILWALTSYPRLPATADPTAAACQEARVRFLTGVRGLNTGLGLPPDSARLVAAVSAELPAADTDGAAAAAPPAATALAAAADAAVVARFQRARRALAAIRIRHTEATAAGAPAGEPARAERQRDAALARLAAADPAAYAVAARFRDEVQAPYDARVVELGHHRRAAALRYSVAGRIGVALEPLLRPLGFDWRIGTALLGALAAKEVLVAQLGIVFAVGDADAASAALRQRLAAAYSPLTGLALLLFCLIASPCAATIAATRRESNSWRWAAVQFIGLTVLAYVLVLVVRQTGLWLGLGGP